MPFRTSLRGFNRLGELSTASLATNSKHLFHSILIDRPLQSRITFCLQRAKALIAEAGPCPDGYLGKDALQDLMRCHNLYEGEPGNLACYDPDKLKILRSGLKPPCLVELVVLSCFTSISETASTHREIPERIRRV